MNLRTKVYLAHSFDQQPRGLSVQACLEEVGIEVINPFQRGEQAMIDKALKEDGELSPRVCEMIVTMDLEKIDMADGVVAVLQFPPSIGTNMEIFYASYIKHKPVFTLYEGADGRSHKHPWIKHLTIISETSDDLVETVKEWAHGR